MLNQETKRKIDTARQILVGKVPDPKAQVEQITTALIYKFMDDMDREAVELGGKPRFFTNGFEKYAWSNVMDPKVGGQDRLELYGEAIVKMARNPHIPQLFRDIFKDAFLPYRSPETLSLFLKELNGFTYDHSEDLGDAFEYLLSIMGSQGDAGQFRTPRHIIDFIAEVIDPKKDETILDPACGTAGFLISAYKHILKENKNKPLNTDEKSRLMNNLTGYDISPDMVKLSKVNMYLHGFVEPKIYEYDTLSSEEKWDEMYDVIMANPPFMTPKGGIRPHKRFSVQANRAEVLFVDYIKEHLRPTGRAGIIVPEGIIFQSATAYKQLRKLLVEDGLFAVVSLPAGVFNPYSGVKTSILFFDNSLAKISKDILFIKIASDGYDLGAQRRENGISDLPTAVEQIKEFSESIKGGKKFENKEKMIQVVSKEKISESGDYNLTGDRYIESLVVVNQKWPLINLEEVCDIYQPKTITSKEILKEGPYKVFGANGIIGYFDKYNHEESEILVTCRGATCGTINISEPKSWVTGNAMVVHPKDSKKLDKIFLYYILNNLDLSSTITGAAQPQITRQSLAPFKIPLPPFDIQQKIINEIKGKQAIIDDAKQMIEKVERERANSGQIFERLKCEWVELGDKKLFEILSGGTPDSKNKEYWNGNIHWATLVDIPQDNLITYIQGTERKITDKGLKKSSAKLLPIDTIIVSSRATIGRVGIAKTELATNQGFKNIIIKDKEKIDVEFLAFYMTTKAEQMNLMASGGTFKEISKSSFEKIKVPMPSMIEQKKIVEIFRNEINTVNAINKMIHSLNEQINEIVGSI